MIRYAITLTTTNSINPLFVTELTAINSDRALTNAIELVTSNGDRHVRTVSVNPV